MEQGAVPLFLLRERGADRRDQVGGAAAVRSPISKEGSRPWAAFVK
ncbi:unannotated protein [freshwater metagenome]|uniref:Unannotated protein n=1 Tax=freshwater metagenome TaxID=449393 RepID=A0A6J7LG78_9ZZZZ